MKATCSSDYLNQICPNVIGWQHKVHLTSRKLTPQIPKTWRWQTQHKQSNSMKPCNRYYHLLSNQPCFLELIQVRPGLLKDGLWDFWSFWQASVIPRRRPKRTWKEVVKKDCQTWQLTDHIILPIFVKPSHFLLSDVISKRTTFSQPFPPPSDPPANAPWFFFKISALYKSFTYLLT